jgi:hypothetical protein
LFAHREIFGTVGLVVFDSWDLHLGQKLHKQFASDFQLRRIFSWYGIQRVLTNYCPLVKKFLKRACAKEVPQSSCKCNRLIDQRSTFRISWSGSVKRETSAAS